MKFLFAVLMLVATSCAPFNVNLDVPPTVVYPPYVSIVTHSGGCFDVPPEVRETCLQNSETSGSSVFGTGFWVDENTIVTAKHVAVFAKYDASAMIIVHKRNHLHKSLRVVEWYLDPEYDIAVGVVNNAPLHKIWPLCDDIFLGEEVTFHGWPPDFGPKTNFGILVHVDEPHIYARTTDVRSGYSGGPAVSNDRQCIVSMTSAVRYSDDDVIVRSISFRYVKEVLILAATSLSKTGR